MERPDVIRHRSELDAADDADGPSGAEPMSIGAALGRRIGLTRLGIHHERIPPGRRTSLPHAESAEEEFAFVLDGRPDVWIDGHLHRLRPGDAVAFPAGTGIFHRVLNDTDTDVRLLILGETPKPENRVRSPRHEALEAGRHDRWTDWPAPPLGPPDGRPRVSHEPASRQRPALLLRNAGTRAVAMTIAPIQGSDP